MAVVAFSQNKFLKGIPRILVSETWLRVVPENVTTLRSTSALLYTNRKLVGMANQSPSLRRGMALPSGPIFRTPPVTPYYDRDTIRSVDMETRTVLCGRHKCIAQ